MFLLMRSSSFAASLLLFTAAFFFGLAEPCLGQAPVQEVSAAGQTGSGKQVNVTTIKVDDESVKPLLVPRGKPLLVNFWATWCEPCRQEFPELVEIDRDYEGKIDFILISLDDPVEIDRDVAKFLGEMGSTMTSYLLRTDDETAVIGAISDTWQGGLPFTALYDIDGKVRHARQGKIRVPIVRAMIDQLLEESGPVAVTELVKILGGNRSEAVFYFRNNWKVLREEALKRGLVESFEMQVAEPGQEGEFEIVLITRFKDRAQHAAAEDNFRKLIKELRPEGPMLVSAMKPDEFRRSVSVTATRSSGSN